MRWLRKLGRDLSNGRNLEVYLTFAVALILLLLDVLGAVSDQIIAAGILATLALLALSTLGSRESVEASRAEIFALSTKLERQLSGRASAHEFFVREPLNLTPEFEIADKIYLAGVTLNRTVRNYLGVLDRRLAVGSSVEILIIDPEGDAPKQALLRDYKKAGDDFIRKRGESTTDMLRALLPLSNEQASLLVWYLPYVPSFGLILIDPDKPTGRVYVEIYQHVSLDENPTFILERKHDPYYYDFFVQQYYRLRSGARLAKGFNGSLTVGADNHPN